MTDAGSSTAPACRLKPWLALRALRGWTHAKAAAQAQLNRAHWARIEAGRIRPTARTIWRLWHGLGPDLPLHAPPGVRPLMPVLIHQTWADILPPCRAKALADAWDQCWWPDWPSLLSVALGFPPAPPLAPDERVGAVWWGAALLRVTGLPLPPDSDSHR
jgi:hypothetical protein